MKAKIEWYQEVLALEPGSKVFFPLARALSEDGQRDNAVRVLRRGLEMHPEFLEARIFLIQLLHDTGENQDCRKELELMIDLLAAYPGFWKAWSEAWGEKNPDIGLVIGYMAVARQQPDLSLRRVLELGLKAAAAETVPESFPERFEDESREKVREQSQDKPGLKSDAARAGSGTRKPRSDESAPECVSSGAHSAAGERSVSGESGEGDGSGAEEAATVRTRSMAEVLAEQGDIAGALEIYHDLAEAASGPKERKELQRRMAELETRAGTADPDDAAGESPQAGKEGLRTILETLAERLEARAR